MLSKDTFEKTVLIVEGIIIITAIGLITYLVLQIFKDDDPTKGIF